MPHLPQPEPSARGVKVHTMNAVDLVGRTLANPDGAEFRVTGLSLDASSTGQVLIDLLELDEDGHPEDNGGFSVAHIAGWEVL